MSVGQFCNRVTIIVRKQDAIIEAAKLMRQHHVGSLVVLDDSDGIPKPIGIVTDRDLVVEILAAEIDPDAVAIGDIMSFELLTARESDGLWDTMQRMRSKGVRRVPVVNDHGALVGILSSDDLLELLADELGELARLIGREQQHEQRKRPA